jgi:predicted enzyme related to lactoylglutathione lyase
MEYEVVHGKICYIEVPAVDIQQSATFYSTVFGWAIRERGDGATAFDDATGGVSGAFVVGRPPMSEVGLLIYVMVLNCAEMCEKVVAAGGEIVQPIGGDPGEITARFRDPAGNILGLYQDPSS